MELWPIELWPIESCLYSYGLYDYGLYSYGQYSDGISSQAAGLKHEPALTDLLRHKLELAHVFKESSKAKRKKHGLATSFTYAEYRSHN